MSIERGSMYEASFTPKELIYKLFKKKKCPICGNKLQNSNELDFSGYKAVNRAKFKMMPNNAKHYEIIFKYYCPNCDISFSLSELANRKYEQE